MQTSTQSAISQPVANGTGQAKAHTASALAAALDKSPQAIRRQLRDVKPDGVVIVHGNETATWTLPSLPAQLRCALNAAAWQRRLADGETLLANLPKQWQPPVPLDQIAQSEIDRADKLRRALLPSLLRQRGCYSTATEFEASGVTDYAKTFGRTITARHFRSLYKRTIRRDAGVENWQRIELYLPDNVKLKDAPERPLPESLRDQFPGLCALIDSFRKPTAPNSHERAALWKLASVEYLRSVGNGTSPKRVARLLLQFLWAKAPFLAASRDALRKTLKRQVESEKKSPRDPKAHFDGRRRNGRRLEISEADATLLNAATAFSHGGRRDEAWREEYPNLSEQLRSQRAATRRMPRTIVRHLKSENVEAMHARHYGGKQAIRDMIGGLHGDRWEGVPSMFSWAMDDMTSNIEVAFTNPDGSTSLILPQIVAVMDSASRKFVGWSISEDKAPTAELVCDAALDAFRRNKVPKELWVENGYVFGKSLLINGKEDHEGRTVIAGLDQFGCAINHFGKHNPKAKAELERGFEAIQRLMEKHYGYTGRHQMIDAPEGFKEERRLIQSIKDEAKKREAAKRYRYTFEEFPLVMEKIFSKYNATPQYGHLKGLTPTQAFRAMENPNDPPIELPHELEWLLANERTRVPVGIGGVRFKHRSSGQDICVRGGQLVHLAGQELWALVHRKDASLVTFMTLEFTNTFTMEPCRIPSARERSLAPGARVVESEIAKTREHERAVEEKYKRLLSQHGDPRQELMREMRNQAKEVPDTTTTRRTVIPRRMAESAELMLQQRAQIKSKRRQQDGHRRNAQRFAQRTGIIMPERVEENLKPEDARFLSDFLHEKENP